VSYTVGAEPAFVRPQVERRYQQYLADEHGHVDLGLLCEVMWSAGGREAIQEMTRFGDILPLTARIHDRLLAVESLLMRLEGMA
jgi:hypothetical protein